MWVDTQVAACGSHVIEFESSWTEKAAAREGMPAETARKTSSVDEAPSAAARSSEQPHFNHLKPQVVRIEVLGDEKVGKTSLICSLVSRHYSEKVPSVLLNVQIPAEESDENVVISITDTSSRGSDLVRIANATKRSDAILLVYDLTRPETFQRLDRWLEFIGKHKEVSVVLVGNKVDATGAISLADAPYANKIARLIKTYPFVVSSLECSAKNFAQVAKSFYHAQKAVLYPVAPLYNSNKRELQPNCLKAIKRTFRLYNRDRTGILSREELNEYQYDCFGMRMLAAEMDTMMEFLSLEVPDGVAPNGLYLKGFEYLWQLFIDRSRPESCWQVLRTLGYSNDLRLEIPPERIRLIPKEGEQSAQLSSHAVDFLSNLLRQFDANKDGNLSEEEIEDIFSICEDTAAPWTTCSAISAPLLYKSTLVNGRPSMSLSAWIACWSFVAQENPEKLLEVFFYLGYNDKLFPALEFVKSRSLTRQANKIERNMVTCYLLRAHEPGMRRLFDVFVGRKSEPADKTEDEQDRILFRAVNAMLDKDGMKYLLMTEHVSEDELEKSADVLCLLHNPMEPETFNAVVELNKSLPGSIPRVLVGILPTGVAIVSAMDDEAEALRKKTFPLSLRCDDDKSINNAISQLVRTALAPPRNGHSKSSSSRRVKVLGFMVVAVTLFGGVYIVIQKRPDLLPESVRKLLEQKQLMPSLR